MDTGERIRRLEQMLDICRTLSTTLEPNVVLGKIVQATMRLTDSEAASILLYDEETHQLRFAAATPAHWETLRNQTVPLKGSIAGKALTQRKPQIVANVPASRQHFRKVDQRLNFITRNLIAVPLLRENTPLGVLEALNKRQGDFQQDDAEILTVLASHAAIALHNARLMEAARLTYRELQRVDRMKSDFIAIASHELRTPLGVILGYATHLQEIADEPLKGPLTAIVRAAGKLKDLVEELSHLENQQQGTTMLLAENVDINALLTDVVASFQHQAETQGIALRLQLPAQPVLAEVDREKVAILVRHLLRNALAFTDRGGKVVVQLEAQHTHFQITVSDTGIGIPRSDLPHIFERFYQVEKHLTRRHGGLGLGLSIAKSMVEAHGGTIWAESEEGRGTTVIAWLPRSPRNHTQLHSVLKT